MDTAEKAQIAADAILAYTQTDDACRKKIMNAVTCTFFCSMDEDDDENTDTNARELLDLLAIE